MWQWLKCRQPSRQGSPSRPILSANTVHIFINHPSRMKHRITHTGDGENWKPVFRIRIRIRINRIHIFLDPDQPNLDPDPEAWIRGSGSGSTPKCHGSESLLKTVKSYKSHTCNHRVYWVPGFLRIGSSRLLTSKRVLPLPLGSQGGTLACGRGGGGSQFGRRDRHSGTLSIVCSLHTCNLPMAKTKWSRSLVGGFDEGIDTKTRLVSSQTNTRRFDMDRHHVPRQANEADKRVTSAEYK